MAIRRKKEKAYWISLLSNLNGQLFLRKVNRFSGCLYLYIKRLM